MSTIELVDPELREALALGPQLPQRQNRRNYMYAALT